MPTRGAPGLKPKLQAREPWGPSGQDLAACDLISDAGAGFGGGRALSDRGAQLHLFQ